MGALIVCVTASYIKLCSKLLKFLSLSHKHVFISKKRLILPKLLSVKKQLGHF